jgi:hypothetical protein
MKLLILSISLGVFSFSFSQNFHSQNPSSFFVQCMFDSDSKEHTLQIEKQLRRLEHLKMVRLDHGTKSVFLLTVGLNSISNEIVQSWFGASSEKISCINTGVYGVDKLQSFPLTYCK